MVAAGLSVSVHNIKHVINLAEVSRESAPLDLINIVNLLLTCGKRDKIR